MVEYEDKLFIIDQHAAHEKVLYEKTMKKCVKNISSQTLSPPIILTLSIEEIEMLENTGSRSMRSAMKSNRSAERNMQ